jgi:hypothetical protein
MNFWDKTPDPTVAQLLPLPRRVVDGSNKVVLDANGCVAAVITYEWSLRWAWENSYPTANSDYTNL